MSTPCISSGCKSICKPLDERGTLSSKCKYCIANFPCKPPKCRDDGTDTDPRCKPPNTLPPDKVVDPKVPPVPPTNQPPPSDGSGQVELPPTDTTPPPTDTTQPPPETDQTNPPTWKPPTDTTKPPTDTTKPPVPILPSVPDEPLPKPSPLDPAYPSKNQKNPFPGVTNEGLRNFGMPLSSFMETREGREVFGCYDERGIRYEYRGPAHPNSTTTAFGHWTGPAPYANDLPVKVKGRQQAETSALDSFSLLYTILCYDYGHHVAELDREYVARIQAALNLGVISPFKSSNEFDAAMRILRSFQRTGHIFDVVNAFGQTEYASRLAGIPTDARWMPANAEMSYPAFDLTEDEKRMCERALQLNPSARLENMDEMLQFMEAAGLRASYPYLWMSQRRYNAMQGQYAFDYLKLQIQNLATASGMLPAWYQREKNDAFKQLQGAVSLRSLTTDLTASILESLL